jgi:hypothetical protein
MHKFLAAALTALTPPCGSVIAASITVSTLADTEDSLSYGVSGVYSPTDQWSIGAGVEQSETNVGGADFSGTALRLSTDVVVGAFTAGVGRRCQASAFLNSSS